LANRNNKKQYECFHFLRGTMQVPRKRQIPKHYNCAADVKSRALLSWKIEYRTKRGEHSRWSIAMMGSRT
jgi:hypothetical protein